MQVIKVEGCDEYRKDFERWIKSPEIDTPLTEEDIIEGISEELEVTERKALTVEEMINPIDSILAENSKDNVRHDFYFEEVTNDDGQIILRYRLEG